jgi:hypothetical protein
MGMIDEFRTKRLVWAFGVIKDESEIETNPVLSYNGQQIERIIHYVVVLKNVAHLRMQKNRVDSKQAFDVLYRNWEDAVELEPDSPLKPRKRENIWTAKHNNFK